MLCNSCKKGRGMKYPFCGMVHIKNPLLLIEKRLPKPSVDMGMKRVHPPKSKCWPMSHLDMVFLSPYLSGPLPYVLCHKTENKMCCVCWYMKHFLPSLKKSVTSIIFSWIISSSVLEVSLLIKDTLIRSSVVINILFSDARKEERKEMFYLIAHSTHIIYGLYGFQWTHWAISHSSQCSTTGVTKAVVCIILSVGWCI